MKFTTVFVVAVTAIASVSCSDFESNASRMARGLPPRAPARRATGVHAARHNRPSGAPSSSQCNSGPVQCCNSVKSSKSRSATFLAGLVGAILPTDDVLVGLSCSPLGVGSLGRGNSCRQNTVCCQNNNFNGVIAIGCNPIST